MCIRDSSFLDSVAVDGRRTLLSHAHIPLHSLLGNYQVSSSDALYCKLPHHHLLLVLVLLLLKEFVELGLQSEPVSSETFAELETRLAGDVLHASGTALERRQSSYPAH